MSSPAAMSRDSGLDGAAIRAELERVVASEEFRNSERRTRLLRYLVEKAIAGVPVKEYTIGVDVFEKPADYDPRIDPAVRVEIGRVRTRLADYYAGAGAGNAQRIEFLKRSYTPVLMEAAPIKAPQRRTWLAAHLVATMVVAVVLCAVGFAGWRWAIKQWKPQENPQAREFCAKARFFWNKRSPEPLRTSLALYQEAIRRWPKYAPAYAGQALCYTVMAINSELPVDTASGQAVDAAKAAIALDPNVADAHAALGWIAFAVHSDWRTGDAELKRAVTLDPDFATAHQWRALSLVYMGNAEEGSKEIRRAVQLDPVSMPILTADGMVSYYARRYDETIQKAQRMLEMDPAFREGHLMLGEALEAKQEWAAAEREFQTVAMASTGDSEGPARLAHLYALTHRRAQAEAILEKLLKPAEDQYVDPYQIAFVSAALNEKKQALEWLAKAVRQHTAIIMKVDPYLDPLRAEPGFARLLAEAHLD